MRAALGAALLAGLAPAAAKPAMAFTGMDVVGVLKECGELPVRTVSCVGASGTGKTTLLKSMFGEDAAPSTGLALLEASSDCQYAPESKGFRIGSGEAMVSLAVSDVVIYNVLVQDLARTSAMADLQPAMEELLSLYEDGVVDPERRKTLHVAVRDCDVGGVADVKAAVSGKLEELWSSAVKPKGFANAKLEDIVSVEVSCLPHHSFASDGYLAEVSRIKSSVMEGEGEPTPAAEVARLLQQVSSFTGPDVVSPPAKDLSATYVCDMVLARCTQSAKRLLAEVATFDELTLDFGEICNGVVDTILTQYDEAVKGVGSSMVGAMRQELKRSVLGQLAARHAQQVAFLRQAATKLFQEKLAEVRVGPSVGKDMENAIQAADKYFKESVRGLRCQHANWPTEHDRKEMVRGMRDFASDRLQLAKSQGAVIQTKPSKVPINLALHWLLPAPFGPESNQDWMDHEDYKMYASYANQASPLFVDWLPDKGQIAAAPAGSPQYEYNEVRRARAESMIHREEDMLME